MNANIRSLQEQVDNLYSTINALRNTQASIGVSYHRNGSHPPQPYLAQPSPSTIYQASTPSAQSREKYLRFQGPTSTAFNFNVAHSSLQNMGITDVKISDDLGVSADGSIYKSSVQRRSIPGTVIVPPSDDPLWKLEKDEAVRLCQVYEEEIGITVPMLELEQIIMKANLLYSLQSTSQPDLANQLSSIVSLDSDDINILKMILATSLTLEGSGESELGKMLFESIRGACEIRLWDPINIKGLILLVIGVCYNLVFLLTSAKMVTKSQYHFHMDDETQAYRLVGLAARLSLEMGLHRHETVTKTYPDKDECFLALKVFWSIYVLDRRYSFGTGMPFAVPEADIDPSLPEPVRTPMNHFC